MDLQAPRPPDTPRGQFLTGNPPILPPLRSSEGAAATLGSTSTRVLGANKLTRASWRCVRPDAIFSLEAAPLSESLALPNPSILSLNIASVFSHLDPFTGFSTASATAVVKSDKNGLRR